MLKPTGLKPPELKPPPESKPPPQSKHPPKLKPPPESKRAPRAKTTAESDSEWEPQQAHALGDYESEDWEDSDDSKRLFPVFRKNKITAQDVVKKAQEGKNTAVRQYRSKLIDDEGNVGVRVAQYELFRTYVLTFMDTIHENLQPVRSSWYHEIKILPNVEFALQVMVILILSQAAGDKQAVMAGLEIVNRKDFSLEWILATEPGEIARMIGGAGKQYKNAIFLRDCALEINNPKTFKGKMPPTKEGIMSLLGLGSKSAIIICKLCYGMIDVVRLEWM